jgi:NNP family nitrate/nitrite transporter-like MFS transporter
MAFTVLPAVGLGIWHSSYGVMLVLALLLGFGGASFAVGVPYVNRWYGADRQGLALGVYGMGMGGTVLAGLTAPRIADATSLAVPFFVAAAVVAVAGIVFAVLAKDAPRKSAPAERGSVLAPLAVFKRDRRAWALTLFYFLAFGGFVAMFLYLPKLLTGVYDLTKTDAGARAAGFALLAVLARPAGGWLSDRVGAARVLRWSFLAIVVLALVLAAFYESMVPLTIACLTLAVALGLGTGAVFKLVAEWFPEEVGTVTGVVGAAGGLGGFFPPLVMGGVHAATGSYALGFGLLAVVGAISLAVLGALSRGSARRSEGGSLAPRRRAA